MNDNRLIAQYVSIILFWVLHRSRPWRSNAEEARGAGLFDRHGGESLDVRNLEAGARIHGDGEDLVVSSYTIVLSSIVPQRRRGE